MYYLCDIIIDRIMLNRDVFDCDAICSEIITKLHDTDSRSRHRHYSVLFRSGKNKRWEAKIAFGTNSLKQNNSITPSIHAEMDAINKLKNCRNIPKSMDLLIVQITKSKKLANSRPCHNCICYLNKLCKTIKIKHVYYSTNDGTIIKEKLKDMETSMVPHISCGYLKVLNGLWQK